MVIDVARLTPSQREAIESLLGRPIRDEEQVQVAAFLGWNPPMSREEAIKGLHEHFAAVDARRLPVSPEEAEDAINEALRSARPGYRPVR